MMRMYKFTVAMVLGLVMCMALFTTGTFAQRVYRGHGGIVSAHAVAIASNGNFRHDSCNLYTLLDSCSDLLWPNYFGQIFGTGSIFGGGLFG